MQWVKFESRNKNFQGAFHICQDLNAKTECLAVSKNVKSIGNYILTLNSYIFAPGQPNPNYQQWRLHPKTYQLINVETGLCLISFDSKSLSNTSAVKLLSGVDVCNAKSEVTMEQKWSLEPLPKC